MAVWRNMSGRLACVVAATLLWAIGPDAGAQAQPTIFGSKEISSTNLSKFEKWTGTLERYETELPQELQACKPTPADPCHTARWRIFLKQIASRSKEEQATLVNQYINKYLYVIDPVAWQKSDYWATPRQFFGRNGDCEDFAIAKYMSLKHLGFTDEDMRILVLQDLNLNVPHAVLVVFLQDKAWLLDNQIQQIVEASRVKHYKPIFSINAERWWLHR